MTNHSRVIQIRSRAKKSICLDSQDVDEGEKPVIGYSCHGQGGNQFFLMSKTFEIRREDKCLDYPGGQGQLHQPGKIVSFSCHSMQGNQMWTYEVRSRSNLSASSLSFRYFCSFRTISSDIHQVFVLNCLRPMIKMCLCQIVNRKTHIKSGSGKNGSTTPPQLNSFFVFYFFSPSVLLNFLQYSSRSFTFFLDLVLLHAFFYFFSMPVCEHLAKVNSFCFYLFCLKTIIKRKEDLKRISFLDHHDECRSRSRSARTTR